MVVVGEGLFSSALIVGGRKPLSSAAECRMTNKRKYHRGLCCGRIPLNAEELCIRLGGSPGKMEDLIIRAPKNVR